MIEEKRLSVCVAGATVNECEEMILDILWSMENEYESIRILKMTYFPKDKTGDFQISVELRGHNEYVNS